MVVLLCSSIGPYHAARFNALFEAFDEFVVVEIASKQRQYQWDNTADHVRAKVVTLFYDDLRNIPSSQQVLAVRRTLHRLQPSAVFSVGYTQPAMRAAARWARTHNAMSVMMTATWAGDRLRFWPLEWLKGVWCRSQYDALFIPGIRSQAYFEGIGFSSNLIWRGVTVVDNAFFSERAERARMGADAIRRRLQLPKRFLLCVSRLAPEKNLQRLIRAFGQYRSCGGAWELVILGSGPLETELHNTAQQVAPNAVTFKGWISYSELPMYYALATALILPSISEPWGLVVNEAMSCGLPVLVSRMCGCLPELCWRGINGFDFDPRDEQALASLMAYASLTGEDLDNMGEVSRQIVSHFTPENWAATLLDCVDTISTHR